MFHFCYIKIVFFSCFQGFYFICTRRVITSLFSGENSIVVVKGANDYLTIESVESAKGLIQKSKILLCNLEIDPKVTLHALKMAKALNSKHNFHSVKTYFVYFKISSTGIYDQNFLWFLKTFNKVAKHLCVDIHVRICPPLWEIKKQIRTVATGKLTVNDNFISIVSISVRSLFNMAPATTGLEDYFQYCDILVVNESEVYIIMNLINILNIFPKRWDLRGDNLWYCSC